MPGYRRHSSRPGTWLSQDGASVVENILVIVLVGILLLVIIDGYLTRTRGLRETALTIELSTLRSSVNLFAALKGKLPESLKELSSARVVQPKRDVNGVEYDVVIVGNFVSSMSTDGEGNITDPFGNRYVYDPSNGRVGSSTEGYRNW